MYFLPTRKIVTLWRRTPYSSKLPRDKLPQTRWKRERPSSLHECLDRDPRDHVRSRALYYRPWFIFLLIVPVVYYITSLYLSKSDTYTQYYVPVDTVEVTKLEVMAGNQGRTTTQKQLPGFNYKDLYIKSKTEDQKKMEKKVMDVPIMTACVINQTLFGKITLNTSNDSKLLEQQYPMVHTGGYYVPTDCISRHKIGILVPYRDRKTNLEVFLFNIHPFLMNQKLEYRIFVVEQTGKDRFNKGRLYNAGFKEMQKFGRWKCVVFHDVDLLPMDERILYTCPTYPRHMCASVLQKKKDRKYRALFGGVTCMSPEHYRKVNGYSNMYWGWGGEDNDMFWRLRAARIPIVRYNKTIAEYTALPHVIRYKNQYRYQLLRTAMERYLDEGLNNVEYKLVSVTQRHLYTHLLVDVNPYKDNVTVLMRYGYQKI